MTIDISIKRYKPNKHYGLNMSKFFITLNTNVKPITQYEEYDLKNQLEDTVNEIFTEDSLGQYLNFLDGGNIDDIDKVSVDFNIEMGSSAKGGRVHSHIVLTILHKTKIQIDKKELKSLVTDLLYEKTTSVKGIYLNIRIDRAGISQFNQERYLQKPTL